VLRVILASEARQRLRILLEAVALERVLEVRRKNKMVGSRRKNTLHCNDELAALFPFKDFGPYYLWRNRHGRRMSSNAPKSLLGQSHPSSRPIHLASKTNDILYRWLRLEQYNVQLSLR